LAGRANGSRAAWRSRRIPSVKCRLSPKARSSESRKTPRSSLSVITMSVPTSRASFSLPRRRLNPQVRHPHEAWMKRSLMKQLHGNDPQVVEDRGRRLNRFCVTEGVGCP
jgi:hypothetical protein